jgi:hypothetical protein
VAQVGLHEVQSADAAQASDAVVGVPSKVRPSVPEKVHVHSERTG